MYQTMRESDGVGIAAPQVGKSLRLLIVDGADLAEDMPELEGFKRVMINPVTLWESEETAEYSEGCLSVPNIHADVVRPKSIRVKYYNEKYEQVEEDFTGFAAEVADVEYAPDIENCEVITIDLNEALAKALTDMEHIMTRLRTRASSLVRVLVFFIISSYFMGICRHLCSDEYIGNISCGNYNRQYLKKKGIASHKI